MERQYGHTDANVTSHLMRRNAHPLECSLISNQNLDLYALDSLDSLAYRPGLALRQYRVKSVETERTNSLQDESSPSLLAAKL